jgi:hypothetical protein
LEVPDIGIGRLSVTAIRELGDVARAFEQVRIETLNDFLSQPDILNELEAEPARVNDARTRALAVIQSAATFQRASESIEWNDLLEMSIDDVLNATPKELADSVGVDFEVALLAQTILGPLRLWRCWSRDLRRIRVEQLAGAVMNNRSTDRRHDDSPNRASAESQAAVRPNRIQEALGNQGMLEILETSSLTEDVVAEQIEANATVALPGWIVADDVGELHQDQMHRSAFLETTRQRIQADVEPILERVGQTVEDCPLIEYWFNYYSQHDAAYIERALHRFVPAQTASNADDYINLVVQRVHRGVQTWATTGEITQIPPDAPKAAHQMVQFSREEPGTTPTTNVVRKRLGKGTTP